MSVITETPTITPRIAALHPERRSRLYWTLMDALVIAKRNLHTSRAFRPNYST